ncbi:MAG: phosphoribosylformylglycinamidine synthase [Clostridiales Family XIII bacterium]|jgi:phosphoribosylformylglycinamidine synthase|nr:phosphoribosylformylglycinamidine synthase [Clostridiales Family XIII bacterium]
MVKRIFVEKKKGFDVEAQNLKRELKQNLGISGVRSFRVINRYDVEGLEDAIFKTMIEGVFSEPNLDDVYEEKIDVTESSFDFGIEYLPGQYDQRADSAVQCIKLIREDADVTVRYAKIIVIDADLNESDRAAIKKYCINPTDSREASREKPQTLSAALPDPPDVEVVNGFLDFEERELRAMISGMGFAMNYADLQFVQNHFRTAERRDPTMTELRVIDAYWSDHCRHTTFLTTLSEITFEEGAFPQLIKASFDEYLALRKELYGADNQRDICLMDLAVIGAKALKRRGKLEDLDESDEINACSIKVKTKIKGADGKTRDEDWLVMFKNETHNHPTEIEPFGGAATCLGGAIRDPLSGRVYVYQAMRVTGCGDPRTSMKFTLPGKLSQYQITKGAAKGYSSYGNQIGLATGLVDEIYHEGYVAKRLEIGAVIGAAPADHVRRENPEVGDIIVVVGGRTGRDGVGGATGSSKKHDEKSILAAGAEVQKGNPPVERSIQRLFSRKEVTQLIKKCNDFGAGGVSVAVGELAPSIDVDLDVMPKKYEGLDGTELAVSESQERMAVVIDKKDVDAFIAFAREENAEATVVAKVTDTGRFRMLWRGEAVFDLSREFLDTNGVRPKREVAIRNSEFPFFGGGAFGTQSGQKATKETLLALLSDLSVCSKRGLIENFDSTIGRGSVLMPLGGERQLTPALGMAAKLPVKSGDTDTATLMTYGFDAALCAGSPYHGALYAVLDAVTKIVGMGGEMPRIKLTFQEYFEKMGKVPTRWAKPFMALLGALKAQMALELAAIGGKDSMSGTYNHLDVPPTFVSFAVCPGEARHVISPEFKREGSTLLVLHTPKDECSIPDFERFKENMSRVTALIRSGAILSAQTIGYGGVFAAAAKMALGNGIGAILRSLSDDELTRPNYGSLFLEIDGEADAAALFDGLQFRIAGETVNSGMIEFKPPGEGGEDKYGAATYDSIIIKLSEIENRWTTPLERVFPTTVSANALTGEDAAVPVISWEKRSPVRSSVSGIAKPRVFMPVLPGTNCEYDTTAAFEKAGAIVDVVNLINLTPEDLRTSIRRMKDAIDQSQIIMIPGGFSGGDEPEGSAKFIAAVFRNPLIAEAVTDLLENRGGLVLGICNGFQALVKLGLLPYGKILPPDAYAPTLTYNTIGRHVSRLVRTRVGSVLSPWLAKAEVGDVFTVPVSHGEGRFVAGDEILQTLIQSGQIATQYADLSGNPSDDIDVNPNGSIFAVEGITSPDGRIFGKMGHSERIGTSLYRNVPGNYDSGIFESGVAYFK